jgi:flagellar motor switch protein FliG
MEIDRDGLRALMTRLEGMSDDAIATELSRLQLEEPDLFTQFHALTAAARRVEEARTALEDPALQGQIKAAAQSPRVQHVAATLQQLGGGQSSPILGGLGAVSPALAEAIKLAMFSFDDLVYADGRGLQLLLSRVDKKTLQYAMKALDDVVADALYAQMSSRAASQLREDISYMGRIRRSEMMDARRQMTDLAREMMKAGELIVIKPNEADEWVS